MTRYRLRRWVFHTEVDIPDNAIGVTLTAHGDHCVARWLEPIPENDDKGGSMSIDYRTLLAEAYEIWVRYPPKVRGLSFEDILLGTRIPGLPIEATFADLLRWGEWVATAERTFNDNWNLWGWVVNGEWVDDADLLAALRTEADR